MCGWRLRPRKWRARLSEWRATQLVEMEAQHARVGAEKLPPGSTRAGSRPAGSAQPLPPEIEIRDRDR